ncbi:dicarboxylate/amino acid:cation (Na or H) symporter (DAACS) family protein [Thraustotheca clavata]|uniref:Amino acid transporter n=1 Tax=Thraustotheca clavata TaxID=74557 RepID=A0A1V9ZC72_9STRA|nr:dicarboxylate/amino acid:cation (Na or H) symporter (DAACS) family protein [Thraustotheca clavata]
MSTDRRGIILFDGEIPAESTPHANFVQLQQRRASNTILYDPHQEERPMAMPRPQAPLPHPSQVNPNIQSQPIHQPLKPWVNDPSNYGFAARMRSSTALFFGTLAGIILGGVLANFKNIAGIDISSVGAQWIGIFGTLFYRAVMCIVIPFVLSSMALSVSEMMRISKGFAIMWRVAIYFFITKVLASSTGLLIAMAFASQFQNIDPSHQPQDTILDVDMWLQCGKLPTDENFMSVLPNGTIICDTHNSSNTLDMMNSSFALRDINNIFRKTTDTELITKQTFSQAVINVANDIVPDNVIKAMVTNNVLSVATFAILFGAAVCKNYRQNTTGTHYVIDILRQVNHVCTVLIQWLLVLAPLGVFSLVAGSAATYEYTIPGGKAFFSQTAAFTIAFISAIIAYAGLILPLFLALFAKINPYPYMSKIFPAQMFAFCTSSSTSTLPITIQCVDSTNEVSSSLTRFVITLGVPLNKDGCAIYFPMGIVFLANSAGLTLSSVDLFITILVSVIASVAVVPITGLGGSPAALYYLWTSLSSVNSNPVPNTIETLLLIDWLLDRFSTALNITGETVVARVIAEQIDEKGVEIPLENY